MIQLFGIALTMWRWFVLFKMWNWHAVSTLALPEVTYLQMAGLSLLASVITSPVDDGAPERSDAEKLEKLIDHGMALGLLLLVSWVVA